MTIRRGTGPFACLGNWRTQGLALAEGGRIALTDLATFQEFTGTYGTVDRIDLLLKPSAPADAAERIRAGCLRASTLERPSEFKESGRLMVRSYQLNLSVLSFVSLFVGMFLVYSLISLHATSRRHELAILRSIGSIFPPYFFPLLVGRSLLRLLRVAPCHPARIHYGQASARHRQQHRFRFSLFACKWTDCSSIPGRSCFPF